MSGSSLPNFIKARNPLRLRALMIEKAAKTGMFYKYFNIQFDGKLWYAWYYENAEQVINEAIISKAKVNDNEE